MAFQTKVVFIGLPDYKVFDIYWVHADIMLIRQIGCLSGACHNSGETKEVHKFYQENEKLYHGLLYLHKKGKY